MKANDAIERLHDFLRRRDYDADDPAPLEEAVVEGIEALKACQRAEHYVPAVAETPPRPDDRVQRESDFVIGFNHGWQQRNERTDADLRLNGDEAHYERERALQGFRVHNFVCAQMPSSEHSAEQVSAAKKSNSHTDSEAE